MADLMDYGRYTPHNVTGGGLGGASENPVSGFMQGYSFVRNQQRQDAADEQGRKRDALQDQILQSKVDDINNAKQSNQMRALAMDMERDPYGFMNNYDPEFLNKTFANVGNNPDLAHLATPEARARYKAGINKLFASMPNEQNGGTFDVQGVTDGLNMAFQHQVDKGTDVNGRTDFQGKKIVGFTPAPDGHSFYMLVQTTDAQGNVDVGPITERRTADPKDNVRAFTVDEVLGTVRRNNAVVNYLDAQQARLGDQEAIKRATARSEHSRVLNTIDANVDPSLTGASKQAAITREGFKAGLDVGPASTLGAGLAADDKDKVLDDANKAAAVFSHYMSNGSLYDNPNSAAQLAQTLKASSPVLSGRLNEISKIQDVGKYNDALDRLKEMSGSLHERAALGETKFHEVPQNDGSTVVVTQTGRGALKGQEPQVLDGAGKPVKPAKPEMTLHAAMKRQTELAHLMSKADEEGQIGNLLKDAGIKATLQKKADAGDESAKKALAGTDDGDAAKAYRQAIANEMKMVNEVIQGHVGKTPQQSSQPAANPKGKVVLVRDPVTGQQRYVNK
jgi:hypothetical protein